MKERILEVSRVPPGHARCIRLSSEIKYSTRLHDIRQHLSPAGPRMVRYNWPQHIYYQKKNFRMEKNIETRIRVRGVFSRCRMLLLPRGLILCSDIYQRGFYWILPRTEQEYTSAQWHLQPSGIPPNRPEVPEIPCYKMVKWPSCIFGPAAD